MTAFAWLWDTIHIVNYLPGVLQIMEMEQTLQQMNLSVSQGDIRLDLHTKHKYYYGNCILTL